MPDDLLPLAPSPALGLLSGQHDQNPARFSGGIRDRFDAGQPDSSGSVWPVAQAPVPSSTGANATAFANELALPAWHGSASVSSSNPSSLVARSYMLSNSAAGLWRR